MDTNLFCPGFLIEASQQEVTIRLFLSGQVSRSLVSHLWLRGCKAICALVATEDHIFIAGDLKTVDLGKCTSKSEKCSNSGLVNFISPWFTHFCSSGCKALRNQFIVALSRLQPLFSQLNQVIHFGMIRPLFPVALAVYLMQHPCGCHLQTLEGLEGMV